MPRTFLPRNIPCSKPGCNRFFSNKTGLTNHIRQTHESHLSHPYAPQNPTASVELELEAYPNVDNYQELVDVDGDACELEFQYGGEVIEYHPSINGKSLCPARVIWH